MNGAPADRRTVCLVTVLYNSAAVLARFVADLRKQDHASWVLVAVDNLSTDGSAELLEAIGEDRIFVLRNDRNRGFAAASNRGIRFGLSRGADFVVLINNDTGLPADFLRRFIAARERAGADAIAPRILYMQDPGRSWYAGGRFDRAWVFSNVHEDRPPDPEHPDQLVEFASGCCLGLSGRALRTVGLLDERFFVYWEDSDYCLRLAQAGFAIHYASDCVLLHDASALTGGAESRSYIRLYYRSYALFLAKHFGLRHALTAALRLLMKDPGRRDRDGNMALPSMVAALTAGLCCALARPFRAVREPWTPAPRSRGTAAPDRG
jgi:GT2 family glycosyltransferase